MQQATTGRRLDSVTLKEGSDTNGVTVPRSVQAITSSDVL